MRRLRTLAAVALAATVGIGQESRDAEAPRSAADALRVLAAAKTAWKLMATCEERLEALPATEVMPLLARHEWFKAPITAGFGIWHDPGSAKGGREAPLPWRVHYAIRRVWDHQIKHAPIDELRSALIAALGLDDDLACINLVLHNRRYGDARDRVLGEAAERVLRGSERRVDDRCDAAAILRAFGRQRETLEVLLQLPAEGRVIEELAGTATLEPRAVPKAFAYLEATIQTHPGSVDPAYFAAVDTGRVLNASWPKSEDRYQPPATWPHGFAPDPREWKYQRIDGGGLTDEYFSETVANALAWWKEHRAEYTPEAIESRATSRSARR